MTNYNKYQWFQLFKWEYYESLLADSSLRKTISCCSPNRPEKDPQLLSSNQWSVSTSQKSRWLITVVLMNLLETNFKVIPLFNGTSTLIGTCSTKLSSTTLGKFGSSNYKTENDKHQTPIPGFVTSLKAISTFFCSQSQKHCCRQGLGKGLYGIHIWGWPTQLLYIIPSCERRTHTW